jgi:glyceraldehyde 3-phosphate dehydrogenase
VPVGSLADCTFVVSKPTSVEEVNAIFEKEAISAVYSGILEVTNEPLVSGDIVGNPHSSIVDLSLTQVVGGTMVKVVAWYDNEFGYANRLVEEVRLLVS